MKTSEARATLPERSRASPESKPQDLPAEIIRRLGTPEGLGLWQRQGARLASRPSRLRWTLLAPLGLRQPLLSPISWKEHVSKEKSGAGHLTVLTRRRRRFFGTAESEGQCIIEHGTIIAR